MVPNIDRRVALVQKPDATPDGGSWFLQELDANGDKIGQAQRPWGSTCYFEAAELHLRHSTIIKGAIASDEDVCPTTDKRQSISAELHPQVRGFLLYPKTSFSMFGTHRTIKRFALEITPLENDEMHEVCTAAGYVSSTSEIDFCNHTDDDTVFFELHVRPETFATYARMISASEVDKAILSVGCVEGFYSEWSPSISTNEIKILSSDLEHDVEVENECKIVPPRLGLVGQVTLDLYRITEFESVERIRESGPANAAWAKDLAESQVLLVSEEPRETEGDAEEADAKRYVVNEARAEKLRRSMKYELLQQMLHEASSYAAINKLRQDELDDLSSDVIDFFYTLESAFQEDSWWDVENSPEALTDFYCRSWQLWQHEEILFDDIKEGKKVYIDRFQLADAATKYLALPIRHRRTDRMLVDALIALEVIAFADEMLHFPSLLLRDLSNSPFAKPHPLWLFVKGQLANFLGFAALPIGLLIGVVYLFGLTGAWPVFVGLGFAALWILSLVVGSVLLPGIWISHRRRKREVAELLKKMRAVHNEIGTGEAVSARHIYDRLNRTTDKGAIWPSEVYPLLEDIVDRGGVM